MAKAKKSEAALTLEERLEQALIANDEQPYKVPDNWCWVKLNCMSKAISKGTTPTGGRAAYQNVGVAFLRVENINDDGTISHENIACINEDTHKNFLKRSILNDKDVLVSIAGTLGKTGIVREIDLPLNTNQAIAFIRLISDVASERYIKYAIDTPIIQRLLLSQTKVTAIPNLTLKAISNCPMPLPPISEQQRIVNHIETFFSKLDEVKENVQNVIDGFENRKSAILHKAFNGELTAKWRKENKVNITEWNLLTLNDVGEYKKGPFGSSITKAMFVPKSQNTYKVYEQGNAIRKTLEYGRYYISKEKYEELKGFSVKGGDIIISCAGTIGEVYKLPDNCEAGIINQALMRVRLFENIEEDFFMYYFGEILKEDINNKSKGTAIKNIPPFKVMKAISIQLPSLPEQREIVHTLNRILFKEQQAKEKAEEVLERIELIKKSILARAFRGELGTNNPDEESSLELLKMVLSEDKDAKINSKSKSK